MELKRGFWILLTWLVYAPYREGQRDETQRMLCKSLCSSSAIHGQGILSEALSSPLGRKFVKTSWEVAKPASCSWSVAHYHSWFPLRPQEHLILQSKRRAENKSTDFNCIHKAAS